jgi:cell pole-organizing protein PopZ
MKDAQDMSMDEILASIRRYVGGDQNPHQHQQVMSQPFILEEEPALSPVQTLGADHHVIESMNPFQVLEQVVHEKKHIHDEHVDSRTVELPKKNAQEEFFQDFLTNLAKTTINEWISIHLKNLVEKIVLEEIKKIKGS